MVCTLLLDDVIKCDIGTGGLNTSGQIWVLIEPNAPRRIIFWGEWVVIEIIPWNKSMLRSPKSLLGLFQKLTLLQTPCPHPGVDWDRHTCKLGWGAPRPARVRGAPSSDRPLLSLRCGLLGGSEACGGEPRTPPGRARGAPWAAWHPGLRSPPPPHIPLFWHGGPGSA